ncbi:MAG TPA: alpha-2-macroglobulin family protein, partial [Candidatus Limnocylindria bacterium]
LDAAAALSVDLGWASRSTNGGVQTDGLRRVATFDARVTLTWPDQLLHLPTGMAAGWYLVDVPQGGRHAQLVLQVSDLSAYVLASQTRTVAWVNDLGAATPVAAATLALADGTGLGKTGADGLLDVATPAALSVLPEGSVGPHLLVVAAPDGRHIVASLGGEGFSPLFWRAAPSNDWWLMFGTDRLQYRSEDTIRVWGLIRSRADRSVPGDLELRLVSGSDTAGPPISRTRIEATARGTIIGELPVADLAPAQYTVVLFVGDEPVTQATVTVTTIRKPAFRIEATTDRRAYISGEAIEVSAGTRFYDGTGAPGLRMRVSASGVTDGGADRDVAADATGQASLTYRARAGEEGIEVGSVHVSPAQPEEGSSTGSASFAVFPSAAWLDSEATFEDGTLTITGRVTKVDLAAAGAQLSSAGWVEDPAGEALPGRGVDVEATAVSWRRVESGSRYDFIEKRNVPIYDYEREDEPIGTFNPRSGADGGFNLSIPVSGQPDGVELRMAVTDDEGRRFVLRLWADTHGPGPGAMAVPYLETPSYCGGVASAASIGGNVTLTVFNPDGTPSADGTTLFVVGRLGVEDVVLSTGAELERTFTDADLPNLTVRAVRLTSAGYLVLNDASVQVAADAATMDVTVEPDLARYAPGEEVRLAINTTGPDGAPLAADVIVQAIDLKLYAIGAAEQIDTSALMRPVQTGFLGSYASHRVPTPGSDCGFGAATGGGDEPREDFEDVATFQLVSTGADGRGSATFELPEDLTSWAVSATAVGTALRTGTGSVEVPVGLPFFVDATLAPEYLAGEEPIVQLRAYGDGLAAGEAVEFTIEAPSLGITAQTVEGRAFEPVRTSLPALPLGAHELTISAERAGADPDLHDAVVRTIRVVPTRLRTLRTAYETVDERFAPTGGDGLTT